MRLRVLLWYMARRMEAEARTNPEFIAQLHGRNFVIQFTTESKRVARFYAVRKNRVYSRSGFHRQPSLTITFANAEYGFRTLTARDKMAFMQGVQEQKIRVEGDFSLLMWFVGIAKYLKPSRRKPAPPKDAGQS